MVQFDAVGWDAAYDFPSLNHADILGVWSDISRSGSAHPLAVNNSRVRSVIEAVQELGLHDPDERAHQRTSGRLSLMFLGMERAEVFVLLSGIIGAVLSAGVAALVAAGVLVRSNRHQRKLADEAAAMQRELAQEQADEQHRNAQAALSEQRGIAERQLAEQKKEASIAREQQAIAEVIIATEDFMVIKLGPDEEAEQQMRALRVAVARWRAELGMDDMQRELLLWTELFGRASDLLRTEMVGGREELARVAITALSDAMSTLTGVALAWQGADSAMRGGIYEHLVEKRTAIETSLDSVESR